MARGRVKFFSKDKGFGFITDESGADVFVHIKDLRRTGVERLTIGEDVEFELGTHGRRPVAVNVNIILPELCRTRRHTLPVDLE